MFKKMEQQKRKERLSQLRSFILFYLMKFPGQDQGLREAGEEAEGAEVVRAE